MVNDIARDIHCDVTVGNNVTKCTYNGVTMDNDVAINLFCYMYYYTKLYYCCFTGNSQIVHINHWNQYPINNSMA